MLLENPQKASTAKPEQMGICLNSLDSEPKLKCMRNMSVTSYLQMMRTLQLTQEDLQRLLDRFSEACIHFGLTISLAKTQVMGQDIKEIPSLFLHNYKLEVVHELVYLGSTITNDLSIDRCSISELRS